MAEQPVVVGRIGLGGSEQLGFYEHLAKSLGAVHISKAAIRAQLYPGKVKLYHEQTAAVKDVMLDRTGEALATGKSVVLDGSLNKAAVREQFWDVLDIVNAGGVLVHFNVPTHVLRMRIQQMHWLNSVEHPDDPITMGDRMKLLSSKLSYLSRPDINPHKLTEHLCLDGLASVASSTQLVVDSISQAHKEAA